MTTAQLNALGLLTGPNNQITGIDLPISNNALMAPGFTRRVRLRELSFAQDLEMTVVYERYIVNATGQDAYKEIEKDTTLTATAKRERLSILQPLQTTKTTAGAFRNATTGAIATVSPLTGQLPAGSVPELAYFQALSLAHLQAAGLPLTGTEPYILVVYLMIANIARDIDARNEF